MDDGCTIAGAWKGFREFHELDCVEDASKMVGIQTESARQATGDAYRVDSRIEEVSELYGEVQPAAADD